jgi:hypothetical protein
MRYLIAICCLLLYTTCTEAIDLETEQRGGELVIFGRISNSNVGNYVEVTRTSSGGESPEAIENAVVRVFDESDQSETLPMTEPGRYELIGDVLERNFGDQFRLEIELDGKLYTSPFQPIREVVASDELSWQQAMETEIKQNGAEVERWVVRLFATSTLDVLPEEFYIRWTIEEAYTHLGSALPSSHFPRYSPAQCYVINDLSEQDIFLLDGSTVRNTNLIDRYLVSRPIDNTFAVKHYFNLIQSAMNEESYRYWEQVNGIVARSGSIFDTPPAAIPSNISSSDPSERVLGHFEVIGVDTTRLLLTNNDIPIFFVDPCAVDTPRKFVAVTSVPFECVSCLVEEKILPLECIFCFLAPGFTSERPSYF